MAWAKLLLAPLLGLSVAAHLLLLFTPLPSRPEPEVEEEAAEEEFVDLLSISSLATPEPEPEPDLPTPAPAETAPAPAAVAPSAPSQPIVPEVSPDTSAPATPLDAPLPPEPAFETPPEQPAAFVQEEEVVDIFTRLTRGAGDSDFDSTATSFPAIAYLTPHGIREWSAAEQACFFTQIDDNDYRLQPKAASLRYLTRNVQFIESQDIPRTFPAPEFAVSTVAGGYCNRPLYQVLRNGQPYLFVSVAGVGVGAVGQQASGVVIIWSSDPRVG
ncbi:hypothetical protein PGN35_020010 [Nodosilinea sp. PGN35]